MKRLITLLAGGLAALGIGLAIPAHAETFSVCPSGHSGVIDGTPTSCPFADNVRMALFSQGGNPVLAYSPVTGATYWMTCTPSNESVSGVQIHGYTCYGGNNAEVVIWR